MLPPKTILPIQTSFAAYGTTVILLLIDVPFVYMAIDMALCGLPSRAMRTLEWFGMAFEVMATDHVSLTCGKEQCNH